jgi:hypothetical protein
MMRSDPDYYDDDDYDPRDAALPEPAAILAAVTPHDRGLK